MLWVLFPLHTVAAIQCFAVATPEKGQAERKRRLWLLYKKFLPKKVLLYLARHWLSFFFLFFCIGMPISSCISPRLCEHWWWNRYSLPKSPAPQTAAAVQRGTPGLRPQSQLWGNVIVCLHLSYLLQETKLIFLFTTFLSLLPRCVQAVKGRSSLETSNTVSCSHTRSLSKTALPGASNVGTASF